jgi:hypothetical protein
LSDLILKGKKMKKVMLATVLVFGALQAGDVVHYDKKEVKESGISTPNHPTSDLYTKK